MRRAALLRRDGNRLVAGVLPLPEMTYVVDQLPSPVAWATAHTTASGPEWYVRTADGRAYRVSVVPGDSRVAPVVEEIDLPRSTAPVVLVPNTGGQVDPAPFTAPAADALPDAHLSVASGGERVYLAGPTGDYPHGVLGDALEARAIVVEHADGSRRHIDLGPFVAEERGVLLTNLDGDGREEIATVLAERTSGAFLAAYSLDGEQVTRGAPIGTGFRWRHLIGSGPLGPDGEELIVVVRTPHIGGVVEYYDRNLEIVARARGCSSHAIGSPNLGEAVIADVNGDGRAELIVPVQARSELHALSLAGTGDAAVVWTHELGSRISGNLSVAPGSAADGSRPALLVPERDGTIHIWW